MTRIRKQLFISSLILLVLGASFYFVKGSIASNISNQESLKEFSSVAIGISFRYPDRWRVYFDNLPGHTVLLIQESQSSPFDLGQFLRTGEWIGVTFKERNVILDGGVKFLSPEEYIDREAAGISSPIKLKRIRIGEFDVYRVQRLAAGTNSEILLYYLFKDDMVLRVGIFPYREPDDREHAVNELISSLNFLE